METSLVAPARLRPMPLDRARGQRCGALQVVSRSNAAQWLSHEDKDKELRRHGMTIRRRPLNVQDEPRNVLEKIIWFKEEEVSKMKEELPLKKMKDMLSTSRDGGCRDFVGALRARATETELPALIAEVKKASPSRGIIQADFDPVRIARAYEAGGAACLSVLTDAEFFQGSFDNLKKIRAAGVQCPLLCKEFVIDPWQVFFARANGADAVLLIASVLSDEELGSLMSVAKSLNMAALVEVHNDKEMDRALNLPGLELVGINNRNLGTFEVDIGNTIRLLTSSRMDWIRAVGIIVVGESGLFTPDDIALVHNAGVRAVLVGESLVKQKDPAAGIQGLFGKNISKQSASTQ